MKTHTNNKRIEVSGAWPALSPTRPRCALARFCCNVASKQSEDGRRGRIIVSRLAEREPLKISDGDLCCSLSPGDRVRVRASVKTDFGFRISDFGFC
jgi:hypothetical protein